MEATRGEVDAEAEVGWIARVFTPFMAFTVGAFMGSVPLTVDGLVFTAGVLAFTVDGSLFMVALLGAVWAHSSSATESGSRSAFRSLHERQASTRFSGRQVKSREIGTT